MKSKSINAIFVMVAILVAGCLDSQTQTRPPDVGGQSITGHRVVKEIYGGSVVEFYTTQDVPGGKFWAVVPKEILQGKSNVAVFHWHGDTPDRKFDNNPNRLAERGRRVEKEGGPVVVPYRPHGSEKKHLRSFREMHTQLAMVKYMYREMGIRKVCFGGHSSGAVIAMYLAQELPSILPNLKVHAIRIASPVLAVKNRYRRQHNQNPPPPRAYRQYDPIDHIAKLPATTKVIVVYDTKDQVVEISGVLPYVNEAENMGLDVRLVKVNAGFSPYHGTERLLGSELAKPESERYRCN